MRDLIIPLEKTFKDLSGQGPSVVSPSVVREVTNSSAHHSIGSPGITTLKSIV